MYANGYSLTDIQKHLEKEGIPSSYGNPRWARNTISEMLKMKNILAMYFFISHTTEMASNIKIYITMLTNIM